MWRWMDVGKIKLGVENGIVRGGEVTAFADAAQLMEMLKHEALQVREDARHQAVSMLEEARAQAASVGEQARLDAAVLAEAAQRRGYEEGSAASAQEWHDRWLEAAVRRKASLDDVSELLAKVVAHAVERIVRTESMQALFDKALAQVGELLRGSGRASLRVHESDRHHATQALEGAQSLRDAAVHVEVVCDAGLAPGSCIFESDLGVLDASLGVQLGALRAGIDSAVKRFTLEQAADAGGLADDEGLDDADDEPGEGDES